VKSTTTENLAVAVVEDELRLRELLVREIIAMGHGAEGFRTADEAWPRIEAGEFDLLLLDLNLPGMDGMELFRRVRLAPLNVAVVVLTGFGGFDSAVQALRWRADDYLTKPCTLGDIERVLSGIAATRESELRAKHLEDLASVGDALQQQRRPGAPIASGGSPADDSLDIVERQHILRVLESCCGNKRQAAATLGISLRTLYNRLSLYAHDDRAGPA
jgi:DNA-binding NtrC family response regulator